MKVNFSRKPESVSARVSLLGMALSGANPAKMPDELNRKMSPEFVIDPAQTDLNRRVFLGHAKDDAIVAAVEFERLRASLGLPDDQVLFLEKGGHMLLAQDILIIASALRFFAAKL